jgi:hypothetical protein
VIRLFAVLSIVAVLGCSPKCKISSECDEGEHCNFTTGECILGCEKQEDCPGNTMCDVEVGLCRLVSTSTT